MAPQGESVSRSHALESSSNPSAKSMTLVSQHRPTKTLHSDTDDEDIPAVKRKNKGKHKAIGSEEEDEADSLKANKVRFCRSLSSISLIVYASIGSSKYRDQKIKD